MSTNWYPTSAPPKESGLILAKCGVTNDQFKCLYNKETGEFQNLQGQPIVFGSGERSLDMWAPTIKTEQETIKSLTAKLDICQRYALGEVMDVSSLAVDYGGTGYEQDPACKAVGDMAYRAFEAFQQQSKHNRLVADLTCLKDELVPMAFKSDGSPINTDLAMVVFKINSVLKNGYKIKAAQ